MIPSLIRTYVPLLVGYLIGWLAAAERLFPGIERVAESDPQADPHTD